MASQRVSPLQGQGDSRAISPAGLVRLVRSHPQVLGGLTLLLALPLGALLLTVLGLLARGVVQSLSATDTAGPPTATLTTVRLTDSIRSLTTAIESSATAAPNTPTATHTPGPTATSIPLTPTRSPTWTAGPTRTPQPTSSPRPSVTTGAAVPAAPAVPAGTVQGRVLWNEQPVVGIAVYVKDPSGTNPTQFGPATTDSNGRFSVTGVPSGRWAVFLDRSDPDKIQVVISPFTMSQNAGMTVQDTYMCLNFSMIFPQYSEVISNKQPNMQWNAFPDAVDYAVVLDGPGGVLVVARGLTDSRIAETSLQVGVTLNPGGYYLHVHAYNSAGHMIGCGGSPFTVAN
jgi:hypothetical protein